MNRGPLPTCLVFLSELSTLPDRTKVRFLGCVTGYALSTGTLTLEHAYPPLGSACARVEVDVNLLLENLKSTDTQVGEWLNITGYVQHGKDPPTRIPTGNVGGIQNYTASRTRGIEGRSAKQVANQVNVQAVMLWSAGGVNLGDYERSVESRKIIERGSPHRRRVSENC